MKRDCGVSSKKSFALWLLFLAATPGLAFLHLRKVLLLLFTTRGVLGLFETETFTRNMDTFMFIALNEEENKAKVKFFISFSLHIYRYDISQSSSPLMDFEQTVEL